MSPEFRMPARPYGLLTVETAAGLAIISSNHERAALEVAASKDRDIERVRTSEGIGELELDRQSRADRHRLAIARLRLEVSGGGFGIPDGRLVETRAAGA